MPTYQDGDSFTVTWPPLVFNRPDDDSDNLGFVIDAETARADGWEQDASGNWVRAFPDDEEDAKAIRQARDENAAELAKEYGRLA